MKIMALAIMDSETCEVTEFAPLHVAFSSVPLESADLSVAAVDDAIRRLLVDKLVAAMPGAVRRLWPDTVVEE